MNELIRYDAMCYAISECHSVDEVKDIRDKALALESYARQAMNTDAERKATEIRIRAERKAGQMMREMERSPAGAARNPNGRAGKEPTGQHEPQVSEYAQAKQSANISDTQAKRWQKLAAVPDKEFEHALNTPAIPSTSGILKLNNQIPADKPMDENALWLLGRMRDFESHPIRLMDQRELLEEMTDGMLTAVKRIAPIMAEFFLNIEALTNEK